MSRTILALAAGLLVSFGCASTGTADGTSVGPTDKSGTFEARHAFAIEVPENAGKLDAWFPLPSAADPAQKMSDLAISINPPLEHRVTTDSQGNEFLHVWSAKPAAGKIEVMTTFKVQRWEVRAKLDPAKSRPHTEAEKAELAKYLASGSQDAATPEIQKMADEAVGAETNPVLVARKLYDAILKHVEYHVKDPKPEAEKTMKPTGKGSSALTFTSCTGNCTDFHALYAAMSRHKGLPTRSVYGSFFKGPLNGQDKDQSYHCWLEVHCPGIGWVPLDVAVADVFVSDFAANEHSKPRAVLTTANGYEGPDAAMVDYYFGSLEERRVTWHYGRDLVMEPKQAGDPLPWNPTGYAELDGKATKVVRKLTFRDVTAAK